MAPFAIVGPRQRQPIRVTKFIQRGHGRLAVIIVRVLDGESAPNRCTLNASVCTVDLRFATSIRFDAIFKRRKLGGVASANDVIGMTSFFCYAPASRVVSLSPSSIIWYQPMDGDALRLGR